MSKCRTCEYALYDGMCLAQGKFTLLDAPACDDYKPRIDVEVSKLKAENAKLREQLERVQPTDCEGNVLDIADTVHMLRSEYDGDHEWDDVVVELALTKWGGDRWIVRGSKGEAWACDCTKTGYDEDAYEASDDVEPFDEPTLLEVENAKLRSQCADLVDERERLFQANVEKNGEVLRLVNENAKLRELVADTLMQPRDYCQKYDIEYASWDSANDHLDARMRELGVEMGG